MGEHQNSDTVQCDRTVEQAILALKKGAHLLKCRRRGKPKFCPFRLSMDEKYLIWYSGQEERQMRLSSAIKIVRGQRTANFQRQLQPDRVEQSFSLIYANGEHTLDLICKDKSQADSWFKGLKALITKHHNCNTIGNLRTSRGSQSCINSPAGFIRRKQNLGLLEVTTEFSQIRSLCGSPSPLLEERCLSNGLSCSSDSFYSVDSSLSKSYAASEAFGLTSPYQETDYNIKNWELDYSGSEIHKHSSQRFPASPPIFTPQIAKSNILKDIMIWGATGGLIDGSKNQNDVLSPKLLESATMFDVRSISLGVKHAALVTREGEVFCWGDGNSGKLGLKVNIDVDHPKRVEALENVVVQSVACSDHQTCAISESGELYMWGVDGNTVEACGTHSLPRKITDAFGGVFNVSIVACGGWHTAIVTSSGQLFTFGDGTFGVLGHGNLENVSKPKEVESLRRRKVISVACAPWHTAAIVETSTDDRYRKYNANSCGKLFTWGDGDKGRLGHADCNRKLIPTCVSELVDHEFLQVSCGWTLTVALSVSGTVYTMGSAVHGQLGSPRAKDKSINVIQGNLKGQFVKAISSGSYHVAVLTSFGNVYTWGKGTNGQLGLGDTRDKNSPVLVEPLKDRLVESVACGSHLTVAICLHKEISLSDQSACSACKLPFGFTRKKHNCYNCGLLFCNACSNKKALNASLALNKTKLSRVCDPCYDRLWRIMVPSGKVKLESYSPRMPLVPSRVSNDQTEETGFGLKSDILNNGNLNMENNEERRKPFEDNLSTNVQPRWGQVSTPPLFHFKNASFSSTNSSRNLSVSSRQPSSTKVSREIDNLPEVNKMLTEEVERLRAEIDNLQRQCEFGNQKIRECQQQLDKTWLLAKEETEKSKAAKDVIKALAFRLHTMKEKLGMAAKEGKTTVVASNSSKVSPILDNTVSIPFLSPITTRLHSEGDFPHQKQSKDGLKKSSNGEKTATRLLVDASPVIRTDSKQNGSKESSCEQVEQYEPGVYITFTILPSGQKTLTRVRFSRKKFTEKEAQRWWEEKQVFVYDKYGAEGYTNSDQT